MRSTQLIVNLKSIKNNINELKKYLGNDINIMPIVKSFGYGSHLNSCPEILNEFDYVGVAYLLMVPHLQSLFRHQKYL